MKNNTNKQVLAFPYNLIQDMLKNDTLSSIVDVDTSAFTSFMFSKLSVHKDYYDIICSKYREGLSVGQLSIQYGISEGSVYTVIKKSLGIIVKSLPSTMLHVKDSEINIDCDLNTYITKKDIGDELYSELCGIRMRTVYNLLTEVSIDSKEKVDKSILDKYCISANTFNELQNYARNLNIGQVYVSGHSPRDLSRPGVYTYFKNDHKFTINELSMYTKHKQNTDS
jgi:hypothetical protein